jgi:hypothetical protein
MGPPSCREPKLDTSLADVGETEANELGRFLWSYAPGWAQLSLRRHCSRPIRAARQPSRTIAFPESDRPARQHGVIAIDGKRSHERACRRDRISTKAVIGLGRPDEGSYVK